MHRWLCATLLACAAPAQATCSIIACDAATRTCGVAVQTNNLAVGASVPYAQAGVGAIVSQFETNPAYGPKGLALLAAGKTPAATLAQLLAEDGNFDGSGPEARQVAVVNLDGTAAVHTGDEALASAWAGARNGKGYSAQGNGLAGPQVVEAMERTFVSTQGPLAERLLAALAAGEAAGGQRSGRESAALLVKTPDGWPIDIDLRVDHAANPIGDLRALYGQYAARQGVVQARFAARHGDLDRAAGLLVDAVARAPAWPRAWLSAARVAIDIERPELALQYLNVAFEQNAAWTGEELGSGRYAALGANPSFARWTTPAQRERAQRDAAALTPSTTPAERIVVARRLLEAGDAKAALAVLDGATGPRDLAATTTRILALQAMSRTTEASKLVREARRQWPQDVRLAALASRLASRAP